MTSEARRCAKVIVIVAGIVLDDFNSHSFINFPDPTNIMVLKLPPTLAGTKKLQMFVLIIKLRWIILI
jgi:hypothetical protein